MSRLPIHTANTILYCAAYEATVAYYRDRLGLPITFASDWFTEFALTDTARVSIADERRATVKSGGGRGITLTLQVADADAAWAVCDAAGLDPTPCRRHRWGARTFFLRDPAGHRIEVWSSVVGEGG
jgi:catechol 2,3-dioxygenase-like lactoylglutathione lyase family enzyme